MSTDIVGRSISITGNAKVLLGQVDENTKRITIDEANIGVCTRLEEWIERVFCLTPTEYRTCEEPLGYLRITVERIEGPRAQERGDVMLKQPRYVRNARGKITHVIS